MNKSQLRYQSQSQLKQLTPEQIIKASQAVSQHLLTLNNYALTRHIACFAATITEPSLQNFMNQAYQDGKSLYLPVVGTKNTMHFSQTELNQSLSANRFGILEPENKARPVDATLFDWVLVPLLGFDAAGNRLGHGAGFYDRFFADNPACQAKRIGVAFECQRIDHIPSNTWDVPLEAIVTEKDVYSIS